LKFFRGKSGFEGMTENPVTIDELVQTQQTLITQLIGKMPERHKKFLIGFERGKPDWKLLNVPHAKDLPAVLWRQRNLDKLDTARRDELVASLKDVLDAAN